MTTAISKAQTSLTLQQQISVLGERLRPCGDEGVAKSMRALLTSGLALPSTIAPADMNKVYAFALSGLSMDALNTAIKKLIRGEYNIDRKSFIPLPPEMAGIVRQEQRVIFEDLARAKQTLASIQLQRRQAPDESAVRRVAKLKADFIAQHAAFKAAENPSRSEREVDADQAAHLAKIMSLTDAPTISKEQMQQRGMAQAILDKSTNEVDG